MTKKQITGVIGLWTIVLGMMGCAPQTRSAAVLTLDEIFYETDGGTVSVDVSPLTIETLDSAKVVQVTAPDQRQITLVLEPEGDNVTVAFHALPQDDIVRWGFSVDAQQDEYFTGLMERVVDGPQQDSWAEGITEAMNLRGQKVDMILKPTTSVYAPYYLSSRGYAMLAQTNWPGTYDFCVDDPQQVKITYEGPSLEVKIYRSADPAELVKQHAQDAGPPFMPPKWAYSTWRWRDEHRIRQAYYDGTPWEGPFNAEVMEDVLLMEAYGIPCGVYWVDRPYGKGKNGYDDFEVDPERLPHFRKMVRWLNSRGTEMVLWIGPFFQGEMESVALQEGYNLAGQKKQKNNYPLCDFTNPEAKAYWQRGFSKLLELGVAGFKLDRAEEGIPEKGPYIVHDGRSIRENRNAYPPMYTQAAFEVAQKYRGNDFVLMPRAAYTGSSPYAAFWGGDIGGTQEGLRASIIAIQRAAVMGYPNWGADTCGYRDQRMEQEVCARWLGFSCFNPIMEVGPTRDKAFWNLPRDGKTVYDETLIACWRLYARLHHRLMDYSYHYGQVAHDTGMPIVRPLFMIEPDSPEAWANWWTYQYGEDLLVSPVWEKQKRTQEVYLPNGSQWQDAWHPDQVYEGGQTIEVDTALHQIPLFKRVGASVDLGDLNQEWQDAQAAAATRPDIKPLEAKVKAWFDAAP